MTTILITTPIAIVTIIIFIATVIATFIATTTIVIVIFITITVTTTIALTRGGPFYGASEACCALCTRKEGCVAWSATNDFTTALVDEKRHVKPYQSRARVCVESSSAYTCFIRNSRSSSSTRNSS